MKPIANDHCRKCESRHNSIFCSSSEVSLNKIDKFKSCFFYKKGETIFHEGSMAFGVYCVNSGKIKLTKTGEQGKEQIVRLIKAGDVIGYRAVISGERYTATAVALDESVVCFIPREEFISALKEDDNLCIETMRLLSKQLKEAEEKLTHLAQKPVRERLAEALLFLMDSFGFENDSKRLSVQLSREDLANLVGTATETAIRLLSDFNKEGLIHLEGKRIELTDIAGLEKISSMY